MKAKLIPLFLAKPGMIVAEDVYTIDNKLVIPKNTIITDKIITKLKFYRIIDIYISIPEPVKENHIKASYSEKIKKSQEFKDLHIEINTVTTGLKSNLNNIIAKDKEVNASEMIDQVDVIIAHCRNGIHLFDMLHCMRESDDLTYIHSLNVALISNILGRWLKLSKEDLDILTLGGLLHDIGKLLIPPKILLKNSTLTDSEYSIIKTHPIRGYQLMSKKGLNKHVLNAILMHHERCDGSGYPSGLKDSRIDPFAKIIAIADVYDAMTSSRVYRAALCPFEAISIFETEGLQKYDPHYIMTFLEEIVQSYIGNQVRLSNKQIGEIVMINKQALSKPVVQVGDKFIDLSKDHSVSIEAIL